MAHPDSNRRTTLSAGPRRDRNDRRHHSHNSRHSSKPNSDKATMSHEKHMNELLGETISIEPINGQGKISGPLLGYDAYSLTVQTANGKRTVFKNGIFSFGKESDFSGRAG